MKIGLVGLARSGKTSTFHLLTGTAPDPRADHKHEVHHGVTHVPDARVDRLAEITGSKKAVYAAVEYVDTPALEAGSSKSGWLAAAMEGGMRNTDALLLVVRAFGAEEVPGGLNPLRDIRIVQEELVLADMIILEKRLDRLEKQRRVKPLTTEEKHESDLLSRGMEHLSGGQPLRTLRLDPADKKALRGFQFLSEKPLLAVLNSAEDTLPAVSAGLDELNSQLAATEAKAVALSAEVEGEIARLAPEERAAFMADLGVSELARDRVLKASLDLLGLLTFLTTNDKESRAWSARKGDTALDAAALVHTDLAHGFIRAEVVPYDVFVHEGGYAACRTKGLVRLEGKEYLVKEGDILLIRHSG